jgi:hypothetical protein
VHVIDDWLTMGNKPKILNRNRWCADVDVIDGRFTIGNNSMRLNRNRWWRNRPGLILNRMRIFERIVGSG